MHTVKVVFKSAYLFIMILSLFVITMLVNKAHWYHVNNIQFPFTRRAQRQSTNNLKSSLVLGIGMSITSAKAESLDQMPLFVQLLPSFCKTATIGYIYIFYLAYDFNDKFFTDSTKLILWKNKFMNVTKHICRHLGEIEFNLLKCNYSGRPAWAQNDAMMAAYRDGLDFLYRVNDDTIMITSNWTQILIGKLKEMVPPLVGVVGPTHLGGNEKIMTHDFVHRTHIDIFGYYYPRAFRSWCADEWITKVYLPEHSKKYLL